MVGARAIHVDGRVSMASAGSDSHYSCWCKVSRVNYFCRILLPHRVMRGLSSISFAGSPPRPGALDPNLLRKRDNHSTATG